MAGTLQALIDAINNLFVKGVVIRFLKNAVAQDIDISQDSCGNWRFTIVQGNEGAFVPLSNLNDINPTESKIFAYTPTVKEKISGFHLFDSSDALIKFRFDGVQIAEVCLNDDNPTPDYNFHKPFWVQPTQSIEIEVVNCFDAVTSYQGVLKKEI